MSFWTVLWSTTLIMVIAEIADRTSLFAMSLAMKSDKNKLVFLGSIIGITVTSIVGIIIAVLVGDFLASAVSIVSGLLFVGLGLFILFIKEEEHDDQNSKLGKILEGDSSRTFFMRTIALIAASEFGDKSQIFLVARALVDDPLAVLLGAIIGMSVVLGISIYLGSRLQAYIDEDYLDRLVGVIFLIVGIWILFF